MQTRAPRSLQPLTDATEITVAPSAAALARGPRSRSNLPRARSALPLRVRDVTAAPTSGREGHGERADATRPGGALPRPDGEGRGRRRGPREKERPRAGVVKHSYLLSLINSLQLLVEKT